MDMGSSDFLYERFRKAFRYEATECQDRLLRDIASFLTWDDGDIMVVNGYAGTGKTTVVASVISALADFQVPTVLLAPTGRAAKVLSQYAGKPAYSIHKHIYRQRAQIIENSAEYVARIILSRIKVGNDVVYL